MSENTVGRVHLKNINLDVLARVLAESCHKRGNCIVHFSIKNCPFEKNCEEISSEDWLPILIASGKCTPPTFNVEK